MRRFLHPCFGLLLAFAPASAFANALSDSAAALSDSATTREDWSMVPEYRMVPGDKLVINFGPGPGTAGDVLRDTRVRPDGRISVFPIGDVVAAGRTIRELELALVQLMAADLRQPRVTVELAEVAGNQVHVLGQVQNPGSYPAGPFMTLAQAISSAGGFAEGAERNSVLVFHRDGAKTVRVARVALDRALKRGTLEGDIPLSRFDIVWVPRNMISNLDVFTRQLFTGPYIGVNTVLVGWELFNLDRVFYPGRVVVP